MISENMIPPKCCCRIAPIESERIRIVKIISSKITGKEQTILIAKSIVRFHIKIIEIQTGSIDRGVAGEFKEQIRIRSPGRNDE